MRFFTVFLIVLWAGTLFSQEFIVDHNFVHPESIPQNWIDSVKVKCKWHYAHTSHGGQLTIGLNDYETQNPFFGVSIGSCNLPNTAGSFCIHDGQVSQTYITPELYWQSSTGMNLTRAVLNANSSLNFSAWAWCCQVDGYNQTQIQEYLDSISLLESEFPDVTFIYMTGNAQAEGSSGYNRHQRNNQIRQYCIDNDKVLFDFADLDCWWFNDTTGHWEQNTYFYNAESIPVEHQAFNGNYGGHTTYLSCQQKAYAVWFMFAVLSGWDPSSPVEEHFGDNPSISQCRVFPNPFSAEAQICFALKESEFVEILIYNLLGQKVKSLVSGRLESGEHRFVWNGKTEGLEFVESGVYFYRINIGGIEQSKGEIIYIK
ncbi:T9SS type A sorting domain-containing protein [candidate division WOR-3 bacterium]|nr:T9SS type A sorting domain-containing protein [candidate division WOR-3 bacterium]